MINAIVFNIPKIKIFTYFRVSYLKVYDETINDLLNYNSTNLELHKDDNGHVLVNCKEEIASSLDTTLSVMEKGCKNGLRREFNRKEHTNGHDIFRIVRL